jgi:hypothetical protein
MTLAKCQFGQTPFYPPQAPQPSYFNGLRDFTSSTESPRVEDRKQRKSLILKHCGGCGGYRGIGKKGNFAMGKSDRRGRHD